MTRTGSIVYNAQIFISIDALGEFLVSNTEIVMIAIITGYISQLEIFSSAISWVHI